MLKIIKRYIYERRRKNFYSSYDVGKNTYGVPKVFGWGEKSCLSIGKYCSISARVEIFLGGEHRTNWISTYPFSVIFDEASEITGHPYSKGDVRIGNDVWIAYGATILSGVHIGDGAVIGAKSVVTKDVSPYAIVGGSPARILSYRFEPEVIDKFLSICWWDWPTEKILANVSLLMSEDANEFLRLHGG